MNDLIFRAWDVDRKEFRFLVITHHNSMPVVVPSHRGNFEEWKAFTGKVDFNSKSIFDGDILSEPSVGKEDDIVGEVCFDLDCAAYVIKKNNGGWEYLAQYLLEHKNAVVFGNIYEDSDFLRK